MSVMSLTGKCTIIMLNATTPFYLSISANQVITLPSQLCMINLNNLVFPTVVFLFLCVFSYSRGCNNQ